MSLVVSALLVSATLMPIAIGFSLVFGILRIVNIAHGELLMLGGYAVWFLVALHQFSYWIALVVGLVPAIIVGLIMERYVFRRFRSFLLPSLIVSTGMTLVLETGVLLVVDLMGKGLGAQRIPAPFSGQFSFLGTNVQYMNGFAILAGFAAVLGVVAFLRGTLIGKSIRACAQDPEAASVHGIDINRNCVIVMAIGSGLAALSGGINGTMYGVDPFMGFSYMLMAIVAVVVGGMGSLLGTALGVFIIATTTVLATRFWGPTQSDIVMYAVLLAILVIKPKGLFGYLLEEREE